MPLSARRLLALVAVAAVGVGAAGAVSAEAKGKAKSRRHHRARAVKTGPGSGRVPPSALTAQLAPLVGTLTASAGAGGTPSAAGSTTATGPTTTTPPASTPGSGDGPAAVQAVGVTFDDRTGYSARLSRGSVAAGATVVQLINRGEDDHNLRVVPLDHAGAATDFPLTGSGATTTRTLTLTAGSYRLFCTLKTPVDHETAGMNATLKVTAPSS